MPNNRCTANRPTPNRRWVELTKSADPNYDAQLTNVYVTVYGTAAKPYSCNSFGSMLTADVLALPTCGGLSENDGTALAPTAGTTFTADCGAGGVSGGWRH